MLTREQNITLRDRLIETFTNYGLESVAMDRAGNIVQALTMLDEYDVTLDLIIKEALDVLRHRDGVHLSARTQAHVANGVQACVRGFYREHGRRIE